MSIKTFLVATSMAAAISVAGISLATAQSMQGRMSDMMRGSMGSGMMGKSQEKESAAPFDKTMSAPMCSPGSGCPCMQGASGMMCGAMMQGGMMDKMHSGTMGHMGGGMMDRMRSSMMHRGTMGSEEGKLFGSVVSPTMNLSVDDVRAYLTARLDKLNNKRLKLGDVKPDNDATISADVVTVDNSLVQRLKIDRHTGGIEYEN